MPRELQEEPQQVSSDKCDLAAVVVTFNSAGTIATCLDALQGALKGWPGAEIVVVDNASTDTTVEEVARYPDVRLIRQDNRGFSAGCNAGIQASRASLIALVNPDAFVRPDTLAAMAEFLRSRPEAGIAGCAHVDLEGRFYLSCHPPMSVATIAWTHLQANRFFPGRVHGRYLARARNPASPPFEVGWVIGSCLMIKREVLAAIGPLDEGYFLYAEEADVCRRAREAGWKVWFLPGVQVVHGGGVSTREVPFVRLSNYYVSKLRYTAKFDGPTRVRVLKAIFYFDLSLRVSVRAIQAMTGNAHARQRLDIYRHILRKVRAFQPSQAIKT